MNKANHRPIGQILIDGGFLSARDLARALAEQQHTNEMLGQVLVGMGVLEPVDLQAALTIQQHLGKPGQAIKIGAGVRKMLGELLVQAGHLSNDDLDRALALQKRSGAKLGEILVRMGLLNERQLDFVLEFQRSQNRGRSSSGPLKLGEIMLSAGYISRLQLDQALERQTDSGKRLGEVLVEEGYAQSHHVKHAMRLQKMLVAAVMTAMLAACGGGGGDGQSSAGAPSTDSDKLISRNYQEQVQIDSPTFYYSTDNDKFWSIQADIAQDVFDQDYLCVMRIHISKENGVMPAINKTFSIEDTPQFEQFPGVFLITNGQESTLNKVEQGTISFEPDSTSSGMVKGTYDVILTDYDSQLTPAPEYRITGVFSFKMGTYSQA
ncbi:MAG: hypothetical protein LC633_04575 [Desulfobulbaceae bacterium]|nr:hypothetical protein [Desulfobulbaceae bacterium]